MLIMFNNIMIQIHKLLLSVGYSQIFFGGLSIHRQLRKLADSLNLQSNRYAKIKQQILLMIAILTIFSAFTYSRQCLPNQISITQCFYIDPNKGSFNTIALALFVNTTLFLGGLHQELYNGKIKKKIMKLYKPKFQWDLFNKLFVTPICFEWLFRSLIAREIDPHLQHPLIFTFFSGILYSGCHLQNYLRFQKKFGKNKALKAVLIQCGYNFVFGVYCSYIFVRRQAVIATMIIHLYANFMGYPHYFQIFRDSYEDQRIRKTTLFYFVGVVGCMICCLYIL